MSIKVYVGVLAGLAVAWILAAQAMHAHLLPQLDGTMFTILVGVTWNIASFGRIGKAYWLHLAPYITIVALLGLSWGLIVTNGQYDAIAPRRATLLDGLIFYGSIPLAPAWLLATMFLCAGRGKR